MKPIQRPIRINRPEQTIFVSKPFLKRANLYGTEESRMLEEARAAYPQFKVIPRSIAKSNKKRPHLKVSYAYMERYILRHEKAEERMEEYKEIRFRAECQEKTFSKVKEWFVALYPEIDDFTPEDFKREQDEQASDNHFHCEKIASGF